MPSQQTSGRREHSRDNIIRIQTLMKDKTAVEIGKDLGIPARSVRDIIKKLKADPELRFLEKSRSGRPQKLNERDERHLLHAATHFPHFKTNKELCTPSKSGKHISRSVLGRTLKKNMVNTCQRVSKPYVKPEHRRNRMRFHQKWASILAVHEELASGDFLQTRPTLTTTVQTVTTPVVDLARSSSLVTSCSSLNRGGLQSAPGGLYPTTSRALLSS